MEYQLPSDIGYVISKYLGKNDVINLMSINKRLSTCNYIFFNKYLKTFKNSENDREFILRRYGKETFKYFDQNIKNIKEIKYNNKKLIVIFNYNFNQPIDNLPNSITHLTLEWSFNQPMDNLSNSITHLIWGREL